MDTTLVTDNDHFTSISKFQEHYGSHFARWAVQAYSCTEEIASKIFKESLTTYIVNNGHPVIDAVNGKNISAYLNKISNRKLIIQLVNIGNERILTYLYVNYKNKFIYRAKQRFGSSREEAEDIFQEAILAFHNNVVNKKLTELTVDVEWYLAKIFDHKLLTQRTKQKNQTKLLDNLYTNNQTLQSLNHYEHSVDHEQTLEAIKLVMRELDYACREVLRLYYFNQYSMESIAEELNYGNAKVAKTKKSKCLRKLAGKADLIRKLKKLR